MMCFFITDMATDKALHSKQLAIFYIHCEEKLLTWPTAFLFILMHHSLCVPVKWQFQLEFLLLLMFVTFSLLFLYTEN